MGSLRFAFQGTLKHFLGRHVFASIQLNHATIIERVSVSRQHALRVQARVSNCKIRSGSGGDLRDLSVPLEQELLLLLPSVWVAQTSPLTHGSFRTLT